jgi:uncharacterized membrane protein
MIVVGMALLANIAIAAFFIGRGAWPVGVFAGLDVLLLWLVLHLDRRRREIVEQIDITDHELLFERKGRSAQKRRIRFLRRTVSVKLEHDRNRDLVGNLYLLSRGSRLRIGEFLGPDERKSLAGELYLAITRPSK